MSSGTPALHTNETLRDAIVREIDRSERRARANKRRADSIGAVIIFLGVVSAVLLAVPDALLTGIDATLPLLRQVVPALAAGAYGMTRYYRWNDKHLWYWHRRHKLKGLLVRMDGGESKWSREFADILATVEDTYPQSTPPLEVKEGDTAQPPGRIAQVSAEPSTSLGIPEPPSSAHRQN